MNLKNKEYLNEYLFDYIDDLCDTSDKYKELSGNLKERLAELFDSIEDEDCNEILCDIDEINNYLIKLNSLATNEFMMIKNNSNKLIEKYAKHKEKILSLKTENNLLKEELSLANEQKENALLKIDEINDEYLKICQEKYNLEMSISLKENEESQRHKLNNEILNDEIKKLSDKINYLNKQIAISDDKIKKMAKMNKESLENISQMKKELVCKDEIIKSSVDKYKKLNEEKENIRHINRGLEKTIEELKNQCKDYQTIINYNEEKIKELREKINEKEQKIRERFISLDSLNNEKEEEEIKNNDNNTNIKKEEINEKRRNAVDYTGTGKEINLNELLFEGSESEVEESIEKKNQIKLAFTRVKNVRRFNKLKSLNYNYKSIYGEIYKRHLSNKKVPIYEKEFFRDSHERLKTIKIKHGNPNSIYLKNNQIIEENLDNEDDSYLYELFFRMIDY